MSLHGVISVRLKKIMKQLHVKLVIFDDKYFVTHDLIDPLVLDFRPEAAPLQPRILNLGKGTKPEEIIPLPR